MEAEKRKDNHDNDDQTDEVNYSIHGGSPGRVVSLNSPFQLTQQFRRSAIPLILVMLAELLHCSPDCPLTDLANRSRLIAINRAHPHQREWP